MEESIRGRMNITVQLGFSLFERFGRKQDQQRSVLFSNFTLCRFTCSMIDMKIRFSDPTSVPRWAQS